MEVEGPSGGGAAGGSGAGGGGGGSGVGGRELVVPAPPAGMQHLCVEYPGYLRDEHKVMETLGGVEGIARQLQENPRQLPLRLRPHDHNCHANFGQREPSRLLLLRLTRPAGGAAAAGASGDSGGQAGAWGAEVVAVMPHSYRFSSPADYQYIAHDSRPAAEQGLDQQQGNPPGFQQQPLLCAPPIFAKQPQFDYAFRGHTAQAPGASGGSGGALSGKKRSGTGVMVSFFDLEVPAPLPEAALAWLAHRHPDALRLLRQLLHQRPVWPSAALHEAAAEAGPGTPGTAGRLATDELLPKLCYKFRNGPWKNAWTRRGFDPRSLPTARQWQCIEYHLPSDWWSKIAEHKKAEALAQQQQGQQAADEQSEQERRRQRQQHAGLPPLAASYSQLLRFEAAPNTQSCSLQLSQLADSTVQQILEDPGNHAQHCSDASGWLSSSAIDAIKRRVKARFQALLDGAPIQDAWPAGAAAQQAQQQATAMQVDGGAGSAAPAAEPAAAMDVDAGPQAHWQLPPQPPQPPADQEPQRQQAAAAAAVAAAAGGTDEMHSILPSGLMASLHDYLAHLPEGKAQAQEEGEEEEDGDGASYQSGEGFPSEDGESEGDAAAAGQSEEDGEEEEEGEEDEDEDEEEGEE